MSDELEGPLMLAATDVLRPPPSRIAKIGPDMVLPRSVPIKSVVAGFVGMVAMLPLTLIGMSFIGLQAFVFFTILGALAGVLLVQWQPQKGETLLDILGVRTRARLRQQRVEIDGEMMSLSIGMARLTRVAEGDVRIFAGAVDVAPGTVDERGVLRSARNKNLEPLVASKLPGLPTSSRLALPDDMVEEPTAAPEATVALPSGDNKSKKKGRRSRLALPGASDEPAAVEVPAPSPARLAVPDDGFGVAAPPAAHAAYGQQAPQPATTGGRLVAPEDGFVDEPQPAPSVQEPQPGPPETPAQGRRSRLNMPE